MIKKKTVYFGFDDSFIKLLIVNTYDYFYLAIFLYELINKNENINKYIKKEDNKIRKLYISYRKMQFIIQIFPNLEKKRAVLFAFFYT